MSTSESSQIQKSQKNQAKCGWGYPPGGGTPFHPDSLDAKTSLGYLVSLLNVAYVVWLVLVLFCSVLQFFC